MGKIYSSSKHSHQDGMVPYMGKGPMLSFKIQKKQDTPQGSQCTHRRELFWNRHPHRPRIWESNTILYRPHLHCSCDTHRSRKRDKTWSKLLGRYCEYCNICRETHCWCFTSNWEEGLGGNNPNPSVKILPSPTVRKPPEGWSESRCWVIKKTDTTRPPSPKEEISNDSCTSMHWVLVVKFGRG